MKVQYEGHEQLSVMSYATHYNQKLYEFISQGVNSQHSVLDFGAGIGEFSNRFSNQERVYVIEPDDVQREMSNTKHTFNSIDALDTQSFDFIYSLNVLEHIEDDKKIVKQLSKHLNKNGELRIFVPSKMLLYSSMDKAVGHFRRYEMSELLTLFESSEFEIKECRYFDFLGFFIALLYKYIGSKEGEISKKSILIYDKIIFPISLFFDKITFGKIIGKNLMIVVRKIH